VQIPGEEIPALTALQPYLDQTSPTW
jgi:hypothetical protein